VLCGDFVKRNDLYGEYKVNGQTGLKDFAVVIDKAISSLQRLFWVSVLICTVWFLSWPLATDKLALYRDAQDLLAWLLLKERMAELIEQMNIRADAPDAIFSEKADAKIAQVWEPNENLPVRDLGDITWHKVDIKVCPNWPTSEVYRITLEPVMCQGLDDSRKRLYQVQSTATEIPLSEYVAVFYRDDHPIPLVKPQSNIVVISAARALLIAKEPNSVQSRLLDQTLHQHNQPKSWDRICIQLTKYGYSGLPTELSSTHPYVLRLQEDSDPHLRSGGVQIIGIPLSIGLFFAAVGFFLAAIAFAMIGPLLALRNSRSRTTILSVWILTTPISGKHACLLLEGIILAVTIIWASFPLLVLVLQLTADIDLEGVAGWVLPIGAAGLVFSCIVYALVAWELRVFRGTCG
jgi:hypothetical protein